MSHPTIKADGATVEADVLVLLRCVDSLMVAADWVEADRKADAVELLGVVANEIEDIVEPPAPRLRLVG